MFSPASLGEPFPPSADKPALRRLLTERRSSLSPEARTDMEAVILCRLMALPAFREANVVCGYVSMRGEIDLTPVWRAVAAAGKTYALPVTETGAREGRMVFRATPGFCPDRLVRGRYDIAEPPEDDRFPMLPPHALTRALILVPGLGFDTEGFRIGYGGGYYDRFLDALRQARIPVTTAGLCPFVCRVDKLPREAHDRSVDIVISEK